MSGKIVIKGARENNLKNVDLEIPRDKFIVFTGLSGSGKTSLAFDTIYAEGQRRYVESLSSYARQFLGQMEKPNVDFIEGLSPAISIDQKSANHNPRSTVGTVTEIYDYLRLLFARVGTPHCPICGKVIEKQTIDQITDKIMELPEGSRVLLMAPTVRNKKGEHQKLLEDAKRNGYVRARIDGEIFELESAPALEKTKRHSIEIIVDRLIIKPGLEKRIAESSETAMSLANGVMFVNVDNKTDITFSQNFSCADCGVNIEEIEPRLFSFNNPSGACEDCAGLGVKMKFDPELIVPNQNLSLLKGAIVAPGWASIGKESSMSHSVFKALSEHYKFALDAPFKNIPEHIKNYILYGEQEPIKLKVSYVNFDGEERSYSFTFEGVVNNINRRYRETSSDWAKQEYEDLQTTTVCPSCGGKRLKPVVLAVTVADKSITDIAEMTVEDALSFFTALELPSTKKFIAEQILTEIKARLGFLHDVGLNYLTLGRAAGTLSGGESQRIRLATQIGSGLVGVVYILDEPSIGLHQRDNNKLLKTLFRLRDLGNTLIVVEHDEDTMKNSDYIVDIGPTAGANGGKVVFAGTYDEILNADTITGEYLSGRKKIPIPEKRREIVDYITIERAAENNLKSIDVKIPLGVLTCVTGVSGSGKSSLINQVLYKRLFRDLNGGKIKPGKHGDILGADKLDKIISIDQSPIGRTPRSNPATYTGLFDLIRDLFAETNESKIRGYKKGRFSFNVKGGRCEACAGDGVIKIEMHFLPDVYVPCEVCKGKRYNRETLEVKYKGKTISDVLGMRIDEALEFFENLPRLKAKLQALSDVGLTYVKLGQSSTTLSGGEAQRVKLATELCKKSTGKTIYVLDEPTTGLHIADVHRLTEVLRRITDAGNTVVVIEHNLDIIKTADYIIDLGPEGGDRGGEVVATGTPEEVAQNQNSYTGYFLRGYL